MTIINQLKLLLPILLSLPYLSFTLDFYKNKNITLSEKVTHFRVIEINNLTNIEDNLNYNNLIIAFCVDWSPFW